MEQLVEVRAAGALILRTGRKGRTEILIIHRPEQDDWSFPKGKLDPGEDDETAAIREVFEETGVVVKLGSALADVHYRDRLDRAKRVRYFHATVAVETEFTVNDEVDEVVWVSLKRASRELSYDHDRRLLGLLETSPQT